MQHAAAGVGVERGVATGSLAPTEHHPLDQTGKQHDDGHLEHRRLTDRPHHHAGDAESNDGGPHAARPRALPRGGIVDCGLIHARHVAVAVGVVDPAEEGEDHRHREQAEGGSRGEDAVGAPRIHQRGHQRQGASPEQQFRSGREHRYRCSVTSSRRPRTRARHRRCSGRTNKGRARPRPRCRCCDHRGSERRPPR